MTDEILEELWNTKDGIAKEHGYDIEALAKYYQVKQITRPSKFRQEKMTKIVGQDAAQDGTSAML